MILNKPPFTKMYRGRFQTKTPESVRYTTFSIYARGKWELNGNTLTRRCMRRRWTEVQPGKVLARALPFIYSRNL